MWKKILVWALAVLITLLAAVYQRLTGPTYPDKEKLEINGKTYPLKLLRSYGGQGECEISFAVPDPKIRGLVYYRPYPTDGFWTSCYLVRKDSTLTAVLPPQPPAGKLEYYIEFEKNSQIYPVRRKNPVIIRFKGEVPNYVLVPHVIFIFLAMLFANAAGLFAVFKMPQFRLYTFVAFGLLSLGGMILGPVVQKFAFGDFWTGVPFGWDLTDNKTLLGFLAMLAAVIANWRRPHPFFTISAAFFVLLIFSIPHSMFGSELDRETGEITQGAVLLFFLLRSKPPEIIHSCFSPTGGNPLFRLPKPPSRVYGHARLRIMRLRGNEKTMPVFFGKNRHF